MPNDPTNYWTSSPFPAPVEYPKTMYHKEKDPQRVQSPEQQAEAEKDGYPTAYNKRDYPKMKFQKGGKTKVVANPEEESKLEGAWADQPDPADAAATGGDRTLTQVMEDAKTARREALDYQQVNDELDA